MRQRKNLLHGDFGDPTIIRVGDDYYLILCSVEYTPALTIWHSKDLINFEFVCHPVTTYLGTVFAPDLVYHEGRFYIYYPVVQRNSNFVVYADNIEGPWSEPIDLKIPYIDPGHIADDEGRRFLYLSNGNMVELAKDGLSVITSLEKKYDGWEIPEEMEIEAFALEAPKLFRRKDYYYLVSAQGGTAGPATSHMAVIARSKHPTGPWENAPNNPILYTKSSNEYWWSKGHGTIFEGNDDQWYMVYHGFEKNLRTLGKNALLSKVIWTEDDWCYVEELDDYDKLLPDADPLIDDFMGNELKYFWRFFKAYDIERCRFTDTGMEFQCMGECVETSMPLLATPFSRAYEMTVTVSPSSDDAFAGLILYYDKNAFYQIAFSKNSFISGTHTVKRKQLLAEKIEKVYLKIINKEDIVTASYSFDNVTFHKIYPINDVSGFNHNTFGGFLALKAGIFAMGNSNEHGTFNNFTLKALE